MVLTDEGALIIIAIVAGLVLCLVALALLGVFLWRRGWRIVGGVLALVGVGALAGPPAINAARGVLLTNLMVARTDMPATLDLSGRRVLFIGNAGTLCDDLCGDAVQLGIDMEASWLGIGGMIDDLPPDHPLLGTMGPPGPGTRVALGDPVADLGGQRFAQALEAPGGPPYDLVILTDTEGLLAFAAPHLLGEPLPEWANPQFATLVFEDWPDPFAAPPPAPRYRTVSAWMRKLPVLFSPFGSGGGDHPSLLGIDAAWDALLCAQAGAPEDRDALTYALLCDVDALGDLF